MKLNQRYLFRFASIAFVGSLLASTPFIDAQALSWGDFLSGTTNSLSAIVAKVPLLLVSLIGYVLDIILWILFQVVAGILNRFFTPEFYQQLGGFAANPVVIQGWRVIVSVANVMFIIALLFIGVGTLFRIEKYNYKRTLIKLIVVALLTNFSLVFAGVILDFFHILMFSVFRNPLDNLRNALNNFLINIITNVPSQIWALVKTLDFERSVALTANVLFGVIFIVLVIISVIAIAFFLVVRTVMLWILLVLSPFAYVGMALPDTQGLAEKWWSSFLRYAIMGPLIFFFVWFSSQMLNRLAQTNPPQTILPNSSNSLAFSSQDASVVSMFSHEFKTKSVNAQNIPINDVDQRYQNQNTWIYLLFIIVLLWGSLIAAASCGAIGAAFFMGAAKGAMMGLAGLSLFAGTKGSMKGLAWAVGSRRAKSADVKMGLKQQELRGLEQGSDAYKKKEAELKKLQQQKESGEKWHSRINLLSAMGPVSLYRAAQMRYKHLQGAQVAESQEALTRVGSLARDWVWGNLGKKQRTMELATAADRRDERNRLGEESESLTSQRGELSEQSNGLAQQIAEKNGRLEQLTAEMGGTAGSPAQQWLKKKIEGEIKALESQKGSIDQQIGATDNALAQINNQLQGDLSENMDQEFIKGARKRAGFLGDRWEEALHFDAVHDANVSQKLKEFEHVRDSDALAQRFMISTDPAEKEAIALKLQSKADIDGLLKKAGYSSVELDKFLKDNFSKRRGYMLGARLHDIALQTNNYAQSELNTFNKKTGTVEIHEKPQERWKKIATRISKQPAEKLVPALSKENVRVEMPDGKWQALPWAPQLYQQLGSQAGQRVAHKLKKEIADVLKTSYQTYLGGSRQGYRAPGWENVTDQHKAALKAFLDAYERGGGPRIKNHPKTPTGPGDR